MTGQKMDHPNDGIQCSVDTCYYHMNGDFCSARKIHVGRTAQPAPNRRTATHSRKNNRNERLPAKQTGSFLSLY